MVRVRHEYPSDLRRLRDMRAVTRSACLGAWGENASEEALTLLELALQEAASNIIRHAYQGEEDRPIELVIEVTPEQAIVTLTHEGRDFDPGAVPPPAFDGSREGGFGLYLIRQSVDEVSYFRDDRGRNGIRLVKKNKGS